MKYLKKFESSTNNLFDRVDRYILNNKWFKDLQIPSNDDIYRIESIIKDYVGDFQIKLLKVNKVISVYFPNIFGTLDFFIYKNNDNYYFINIRHPSFGEIWYKCDEREGLDQCLIFIMKDLLNLNNKYDLGLKLI